MSVVNTTQLKVDTTETLATGVDAASSPIVDHTAFTAKHTLNASSSVPATKCAYDAVALVAGAKTIDLTALVGTNDAAVDGTGLKVQAIKFKNKTGNAAMTFTEGAATGYELLGNAFTFILLADQEAAFYLHESAPDISGSLKHIDVTGTGTEEFELSVVMG
jgi:hypothetical protein